MSVVEGNKELSRNLNRIRLIAFWLSNDNVRKTAETMAEEKEDENVRQNS